MRVPQSWPVAVAAFTLGLLAALLLGTACRQSPSTTPTGLDRSIGPGGTPRLVLILSTEPDLGAPVEFTGSVDGEESFRHVYRFARRADAERASQAARGALMVEFNRVLRGE